MQGCEFKHTKILKFFIFYQVKADCGVFCAVENNNFDLLGTILDNDKNLREAILKVTDNFEKILEQRKTDLKEKVR